MSDLPKAYDPSLVEEKWQSRWIEEGCFKADPASEKPAYSVVIPPPNVTGVLHLGHVLNNTIQDILVRRARQKGYEALWLPGTDHAGIATQVRVEKDLKQTTGRSRHDLGREAFLEKVWEWKEKHGGIIINQLHKLGCSCDWDRERFTMDEEYTKAVGQVFIELFKEGLIYRGRRMVNWCPVSLTALSDEEVIMTEQKSKLYTVLYKLEDGSGALHVATTRPETIMADVAVAVNPKDPRYAHLIGKNVMRPLNPTPIPIIGDEYVEIEFGTGALKITPAHDKADFEIGRKFNLEIIDILTPDGHINCPEVPELHGMDRFDARRKSVEMLEASGLMVNVEDYDNKVGFSERANVPIEPRLSMQWFLKYPCVKEAADAVAGGDITFRPARWAKTYAHWLENIQDWCISRQLWWGHRIPVWYRKDKAEELRNALALDASALEQGFLYVGTEPPQDPDNWIQDNDVMDTWFSSWLWPFSTMDEETRAKFYPTTDLVTGPDIIFFWVARMIMAGYEYRGEKPFGNVYFTGIVRDKIGRKMSKQLGNSPDPLELIEKFGADGVRMAMLISSSAGNDVMFDEALCEQGRNFGNKIWNAYRLLNGWAVDAAAAQSENNRLAVAWFGQALGRSLRQIAEDFKSYRISEAFKEAYRLFWDDFSGLYLEMAKPAYGQPIDAPTMEATKGYFDALMRVLHPFMPFVTEEIWQDLAPRAEGASICVAQMPEPAAEDAAMLARFELAKEIITSVRNIRNQKSLPQKEALTLRVIADENYPAEFAPVVMKMANLTAIETVAEKDPAAAAFIVKTTQYFVPMAGKIDVEAEIGKLTESLAYYEGFLASVMKKLSNERFVASAPEKVVANERAKQADAEAKITAIREQLAALESGK